MQLICIYLRLRSRVFRVGLLPDEAAGRPLLNPVDECNVETRATEKAS